MNQLYKNSMLHWWPLIKDSGIPVPKTEIIEFNTETVLDSSLGKTRIQWAAEKLGYPVFLRTDLCSGKHDWEKSCFLKDSSNLPEHIKTIMDDNARWKLLGIYPKAFVVREFLQLETAFTAFAGNMPINKERRYFIKNGQVMCQHPYWPKTAFNRHPARMAEPGYESKLEEISALDGSEGIITEYVNELSRLDGSWSVDFAKGKNGIWYLIDMALAENSYHIPHGD